MTARRLRAQGAIDDEVYAQVRDAVGASAYGDAVEMLAAATARKGALTADRWAERRECLSREDAVTFSMQLLSLGKEMPPLNRNAEELKAEV